MNDAGDIGAKPCGGSSGPGLRRFLAGPSAVFALVFLWRAVLLAGLSLPVPSNDSFFYDGPVVNFLLHGTYANPALAPALPISGTERFCAYPPLYQAALWGWMAIFGTSVLAAMAFHLVLFGAYLRLLLASLRRLRVPVWTIRIAGLFLLAITFDDRPDSLAHVWGIAAVYAWIRSRPSLGSVGNSPGAWAWVMAILAILTLATSLQIGAVYCLLIGVGVLAARLVGGDPIPWSAMAVLGVVPVALVAFVALHFPRVWAGFLEHARQTPSVSGWRFPKPAEILKIIRTVPGILAVTALLPFALRDLLVRPRSQDGSAPKTSQPKGLCGDEPSPPLEAWRYALITTAGLVAPLAITAAALFVLTPNSVMFASQLQPLLVATFLALAAANRPNRRALRWQLGLFLTLAGLASIRAAGLTTWGAACALNDGCRTSIARVETELQHCSPGSTVILSSPYLYQAARHPDLRWIHCDWMAPADRHRTDIDWQGLNQLKPARIILTQFDFYRRFQPLLEELKQHPSLARFTVVNTATLRTPDSMASLQKVVQHISWAPIVVTIQWQ